MVNRYPFQMVGANGVEPATEAIRNHLKQRPFARVDAGFKASAPRFRPGEALQNAINTAIAVGDPLLLTGEPGTGKTQAAYYAAHQLNLELFHFQTRSTSTVRDLLYDFDMVRYFHDAHIYQDPGAAEPVPRLNKEDYVEARPLWQAMRAGKENGYPAVLLVDEIDKAPRDFPNDLLHELDQMAFTVLETGQEVAIPNSLRPVVFITSNSERRLPEPFLRRCVYHHIVFDEPLLREAVAGHRDAYPDLSEAFLETAIAGFMRLRQRNLRKLPATGEFFVWLQVLAAAADVPEEALKGPLDKLPYLGTLIKDHQDMAELKGL
ncbi:MAG: MoxR family ATPase [Acidobacteriota bacterium]|nr:MoxR family ATPase [Acidobacteriota bacterium]